MRLGLALILCWILCGCASVNPFQAISSPPQQPRKMASYVQTEKQVPLKVGMTPDGKEVIAYATERTYTADASEIPARLTFLQRIGRWIGGLSLFGALFVLASLLFFGGAPILWLYSKFLKARVALKRTVAGIEEMTEADKEKVKAALSKSQDTHDKRYIADLKAELSKEKVK